MSVVKFDRSCFNCYYINTKNINHHHISFNTLSNCKYCIRLTAVNIQRIDTEHVLRVPGLIHVGGWAHKSGKCVKLCVCVCQPGPGVIHMGGWAHLVCVCVCVCVCVLIPFLYGGNSMGVTKFIQNSMKVVISNFICSNVYCEGYHKALMQSNVKLKSYD